MTKQQTANGNDQSKGKLQNGKDARTPFFLLFAFCCLIGHCCLGLCT